MKKVYLPLLIASVLSVSAQGQSPEKFIKKLGNEPVFFIDSVRVSREDLGKYDPNEVASVSVYKEARAIALLGEEGKDGAVYVETKVFVKKRYWKYFSSKSKEYALAVPDVTKDSTVQYVLNGRLLKGNFEGNLSSINDAVFKSITVISKEALQQQYGVTDKRLGVVIVSDTPPDMYKGKEKLKE